MSTVSPDLSRTVFAKTAVGQQEIQSRSLGLAPLLRRVLVLIDGRRNGQDLAVFVPGHDVEPLLKQLVAHGCIDAQAPTESVSTSEPTAVDAAVSGADAALAGLPPAENRSTKEVEMARNFMTNSVNSVFGMNLRLSMIEAIFACQTAQDLRRIYPTWVETMKSSTTGSQRLPEFRERLFKVL